MTRPRPFTAMRARGQAMVEYLVVLALLTALVAVPIGGADSAVELLMRAIHTAYVRFLAALSLPI